MAEQDRLLDERLGRTTTPVQDAMDRIGAKRFDRATGETRR